MTKIMLQGTHGIILFTAICAVHIMIWKLHEIISTESVHTQEFKRVKRNVKPLICEEITSRFLTMDPSWIDGQCKRQWPEGSSCQPRRYGHYSNYHTEADKGPWLPKIKVVHCDVSASVSCWDSLQIAGSNCSISYVSQGSMETVFCSFDHCPRRMIEISNKLAPRLSPFVQIRCHGPQGMQQEAMVTMVTPIVHHTPIISKANTSSLRVHVLMFTAMSRDHFYNELKRTESFLSKSTVFDFPFFQHITLGKTSNYVEGLLSGTINPSYSSLRSKLSFASHNLCGGEGKGLDQFVMTRENAEGNEGNLANRTNTPVSLAQFVCMLRKRGHPVKFEPAWHLAMALHVLKNDPSEQPCLTLTVLDTVDITSGRHRDQHDVLDETLRDYLQDVVTSTQPILTLIVGAKGLQPIKLPHSSTWQILQEDNPILLMAGNQEVAEYVQPLNTLKRSLITLWDLHGVLGHLLEVRGNEMKNQLPPSPLGFLRTLETNRRTCDSLGVAQPNLCVCSHQTVKFSNDTLQVAKAEFALGKLNELIQQQVTNPWLSGVTSFSRSSFGLCHKLIGVSFSDVSIMHTGGALRTVMLITLSNPTNQPRDRVSVTVDLIYSDNSQQMLLVDFSGVQSASDYKGCRDDRVTRGLCVCDLRRPKFTLSRSDALRQLHSLQFGLRPIVINIHQACLFLAVRNFVSSASFYALNVCDDRVYSLRLNVKGAAVIMSSPSPIVRDVSPFHEIFLVVAMQATYYSYPQIWYTHSFSVFYVTD